MTDLSELIADGFTVYQDTDYSTLPENEFDVVTLLDVVEHVRDPQHLFESVHRCLKPGGLIYFHVPVVSRLDRVFHGLLRVPGGDRVGKIWQQGRTSVYHLQNYTPSSLDKLMADSGFGEVSLEVANELSWPIEKYVRIYFVERLGLPQAVGAPATQVFGPILKSDYLNANKALAWGRKPAA